MEDLRNFRRISWSERWFWIRVTLLLIAVNSGLRIFSYRRVYRLLEILAKPREKNKRGFRPDSNLIIKIVNVVGRRLVGADSCLPQALVGRVLLLRYGYDPVLRIGANKDTIGTIKAHAWVELEGEIVIGGPSSLVQEYIPLGDLDNINL